MLETFSPQVPDPSSRKLRAFARSLEAERPTRIETLDISGSARMLLLLRDNQNHARCDNQASLPAVSVVQRKLHPGIMMSGCQAGVKPGPLGPRLWRLRA